MLKNQNRSQIDPVVLKFCLTKEVIMYSRAKSAGSVAPKERINISYRPATGSAKEGVELPFKMLVLGNFTQRENSETVEERKLVNVNSHNFDQVLNDYDLSINCTVENKILNDGSSIDISLKINELRDFEPDNILGQIDELKEVLRLRDALKSLKGPLGNSPQMRKKIKLLLADDASRESLMKEIGMD
jgi:type VI secretion system protein ImpB|tara:strand:- start:291 stop:854 length:564 start_codon:yes stop_codon:yes gene_type:complete